MPISMRLRTFQVSKLLKQLCQARLSTTARDANKASMPWFAVGALAAGGLATGLLLQSPVKADIHVHPPAYPWSHSHPLRTFDHASIRRGYQVYKQVCAACHGMQYVAFRELVGVSHTEEEVKAICSEILVEDGPDEEGNMFQRPGKLSDYFQNPYENLEKARAANSGAEPPDLSFMALAREGGEDYIFSLLTGYKEDPPAGVEITEDQHFNAYFPGQITAMAQQLYDGVIEYEDGTPATVSQMAKDVAIFLRWASEPHHDDSKRLGLKGMVVMGVFVFAAFYYKKVKWSYLKSRKIMQYKPMKS